MPIKITTRPSNLKNASRRYQFISRETGKISLSELLDKASKANTTVTRADLAACVEVVTETARRLVHEGYRVELPFADIYIKASGAAEEQLSPFLPKSSTNNHRFTLRTLVHKNEADKVLHGNIQWERADFNRYRFMPSIRNAELWPGNIVFVQGRKLSFDQDMKGDGLHLISESDKEEILPLLYNKVTNVMISAVFAPLRPGRYRVLVINRQNTCNSLQFITVPV